MRILLFPLIAFLMIAPSQAQTKVGDVTLPNTMKVGDASLQLNGAGIREKMWFESWQMLIVNHRTWEVNYYDDYRGEVKIYQLDNQNNDTYSITVTEAYPKTISPQDLSWSSNDSYQTVSVEFTYRYWLPKTIAPLKGGSSGPSRTFGQGTVEQRRADFSSFDY